MGMAARQRLDFAVRAKPAVAYEGPHCYIWRETFKTIIA